MRVCWGDVLIMAAFGPFGGFTRCPASGGLCRQPACLLLSVCRSVRRPSAGTAPTCAPETPPALCGLSCGGCAGTGVGSWSSTERTGLHLFPAGRRARLRSALLASQRSGSHFLTERPPARAACLSSVPLFLWPGGGGEQLEP